jgi:hypothetical protein
MDAVDGIGRAPSSRPASAGDVAPEAGDLPRFDSSA